MTKIKVYRSSFDIKKGELKQRIDYRHLKVVLVVVTGVVGGVTSVTHNFTFKVLRLRTWAPRNGSWRGQASDNPHLTKTRGLKYIS